MKIIKKTDSQLIYVHAVTGRPVVESINDQPSLTQQQFAADCDINNIMKKYSTTGQFSHLTSQEGIYADFSNIPDYDGMLNLVRDADSAFLTLPADVRIRFQNSPHQLIQFLQNPANHDEGVKLGLINKPTTPPPTINNDLNDAHLYEEITTTTTKKPRAKT